VGRREAAQLDPSLSQIRELGPGETVYAAGRAPSRTSRSLSDREQNRLGGSRSIQLSYRGLWLSNAGSAIFARNAAGMDGTFMAHVR